MKIKFESSFLDSLDLLNKRDTWYYRTYHLFRSEIPSFISNVWLFRKALWSYRWWDYTFTLGLLQTSLRNNALKFHKHGIEVEKDRSKKVLKMIRASRIIDNILNYNYMDMAEMELGVKYRLNHSISSTGELEFSGDKKQEAINKKISLLTNKIEEDEWKELFDILRGQDRKHYFGLKKSREINGLPTGEEWDEWFDGSGMRGWWD